MWIIQKENERMVKPVIEVSCAILSDGDRVLVAQRSETMPHPLKWEFPGGKLKPGETPEGCIIREIREELGVEISVNQLLPSVKHVYNQNIVKLFPFICRIERGTIRLSEHRTYQWVRRPDLQEVDWVEADLEVIALLNRIR
jgi:8-oxo-dGTP diphosphatase